MEHQSIYALLDLINVVYSTRPRTVREDILFIEGIPYRVVVGNHYGVYN